MSYFYNICLSAQENTNANVLYSGIYPELFNIQIQENGVYDFGSYNLNSSKTLGKLNNSSAFVNLGLIKKIYDKFYVGLYYGSSIFYGDFLETSNNLYISDNSEDLNSVLSNLEDLKLRFRNINFKVKYNL